ncbi:unnamed protein product [Adineta steineri]|uniref:Uncharacterized protein n=2 Tax=Adineta steineri TaxID=433720 RepID=A0A813QAF5_9BILA|nr:unnamed protein product [Adineta steineri]CAF3523198.1 unnamed protein product [Adineta steineri]
MDHSRVRNVYKDEEAEKPKTSSQLESRRIPRRNALADISTVSTNANTTSQKHQYNQLAERVRQLQKEIVPDFAYQRTPSFSPYSSLTPSSTGSNGNLSTYPHQQNISVSSGSSSSSVPTQRFGLSSRILERAHQIPERFWIDWQQKQMQDRIDELEYIKNNLGCSPGSSLHTDENGIGYSPEDSHRINDDIRRRSVLYSHEAQRLANERRTSLARTTTFDEIIPKQNIEDISPVFDNDDQSSFNFDQRSDKIDDIADLSDLDENPPKAINPISSVQQFQTTLDRSRLTISLPFTYTNAREQIIFPNTTNYRQISVQPLLEKVIEVSSDDAMETITSPTNSIEDVAQINTEVNLTLLKREDPQKINPLYYTRATVNRNIEFRKFRPLLSRNNMNSINKDTTISIPIFKRKVINDSRSSSPTLSFKSIRSRFSSITDCEDLNDDIQSLSVISSSPSSSSLSLSVPSRSHSTSPYNNISPVTQYTKHNNNYPSSKQVSSHNYTCFPQDLSMINNVSSDFEQENENYSCSSCSITSSEVVEEIKDNLSFSYPLFTTSSQRQRKRKKKSSNSSYLTLVSTSSSSSSLQNNRSRLSNSFCQTKENNNHNKRTLKIAHNTSIISSKRTWQWKQNDGGFQRRDILVNNNNDSNDDVTRSSSPSIATAVADRRLIQRQRRKQTRLKGKAESKKRKEKKKNRKKERNKKSLLSTTEVEAAATEAPLFQFSTVDRAIPDKRVIFYPYEQLRCVDRSKAKEKVCFPIQTTSAEHQKQESKLNLTMADGYTNNNTIPKRKENVRVFVRRRRRTTRQRKRTFLHSSSSSNSHETIPSSPNNLEELVTLIQQEINNKQEKSQKNKNIIVVNYKPVFINSNQQKQPPSSSPTKVSSSIPISKPKLIPTDDDFSSATHYSRRHSLTTTSSDGSPLRSTTNRSQQQQQQSASLDVPDVEDPLMFIEMMYQQLFTEDGRLRNGTESTALADCVKQIVRNSRRNSISSSIANGTASPHSKHHHQHLNINHQQQKFSSPLYHHRTPSKSQSLSSSPHLIPNGEYNSTTEEEEEEEPEEEKDDDDDEEEEEPNTLVQVNNQRPVIIMNTDTTKNSEQLKIDNYSQIHAFLNSCQQKQITINRPTTATTTSNGFRFSIDDTDNEDFDTFSDLNSIRFNTKTIGTSPSIDEDLTHTDSRFLSSSGYHSLDRSTRFLKQQKLILSKSHSENDLFHSMYKTNIQTRCIHYCPDCIHPPIITVIPPLTSTSLSIIRRIQQPIGDMIMKYLNFILVSKNVLLLPFFIFLLRQRSIHVGN